MSYTLSNDQIIDLASDTVAAIGKYLGYEYQKELFPYIFRPLPCLSFSLDLNLESVEDELSPFMLMSARDILKELGPISKEDYDYYESL